MCYSSNVMLSETKHLYWLIDKIDPSVATLLQDDGDENWKMTDN